MKPEIAIQNMRDVIRRKHLSLSTEENYLQWLVRFMRFVSERFRDGKPEQKMESFLTQLARQDVSASTQNQAFCAILFFYKEVLKQEVGKVDSLLEDSKLVICGAKGGKDRFVAIPCSLAHELAAQLKYAKVISEQDRFNRVPVALPGLLAKKYPHWQFSPKWAFLFPSRTTCVHPREGFTVRWRCHEANVQRAVRAAARPLGLDITPHHLRHAYATHCLNGGQNPRAIQQAMGHANLETTMGYLHAEALSVKSPLEFQTTNI